MRIIQVGTGFWGSSWLRVVSAAPDWELAGVVDLDETALARAAEAAGVPQERRFGSLAAALGTVEADAALVVVPPALHAPVALEVLGAGLHCLLEKPLATSLVEARQVVERADAVGRTVMVSQNYRFKPAARTVRRLVADGVVGRIEAVYVRFARATSIAVTGFRHEMQEPLILDMAIHHLDAIRGVLGLEPVRVWARSFNPSWSPFRGNAAAVIELETHDGAVVSYAGSLAHRGPGTGWDGVWDIQGELGSIAWAEEQVVLYTADGPVSPGRLARLGRRRRPGRVVPIVPLVAAERAGLLAELAAALRDMREPETGGRDNLRSLALVLGAVESARRGESVDLGPLAA